MVDSGTIPDAGPQVGTTPASEARTAAVSKGRPAHVHAPDPNAGSAITLAASPTAGKAAADKAASLPEGSQFVDFSEGRSEAAGTDPVGKE